MASQKELMLRYGCNPQQKPARVHGGRGDLPLRVLNGSPGYINLLDALNSWQLVRELKQALGMPAAASFKHVSPAGAAVGLPLGEPLRKACCVDDMELSDLAAAYARARGADRVSSFGDWVALSDPVDVPTANLLAREVSDGVIAPGCEEGALAILQNKRGGRYNVIEIDPEFEPPEAESRDVFGVTFEQRRNDVVIGNEMLQDVVTRNREIPDSARRDMILSLIALKYTQSNSVCLAYDGQVIGVGAGQQSRIHCTRLAASKADTWYLRQHPLTLGLSFKDGTKRPVRDNTIDGFLRDDLSPQELVAWEDAFSTVPERLTTGEKREWLDGLTGVCLGSDAFFPFRDSIDRGRQSGVSYVSQPGGSMRDYEVIGACDDYGIVMASSGLRLFHH